MTIRKKLIIGFSLLLLILAGVTLFGYERLGRMDRQLNSFYDNRFQKVMIVVTARSEVNTSGRVMNDILLGAVNPGRGIEEISARLSAAGKEFKKLTDSPETNPVEKQLLEGIKADSGGYGDFLRNFMELVRQGKLEDARKLYIDSGRAVQDKVVNDLNGIAAYQQKALEEEIAATKTTYRDTVRMVAALAILGLLLGLLVPASVLPSITRGLNELGRMADRFAKGRLRGFAHIQIDAKDELGDLARIFRRIALDLQARNEKEAEFNAVQARQARKDAQMARVTELLRQTTDMKLLAKAFINEFTPVLGAAYGAVYLTDPRAEEQMVKLASLYGGPGAVSDEKEAGRVFRFGEGLVGQCVLTGVPIVLDDVPEGYVKVESGLGSAQPKQIVLQPIMFDEQRVGVVEMASVSAFSSANRELLADLSGHLGMLVHNIRSRERVEELLRESQAQSEELQVQSEELLAQQDTLRLTNDELEAQRNELKRSEERLQQQQEELEHSNQELTIQTQALEEQLKRTDTQNRQITRANAELERQALQLAMTGKYRSEFLANMSHELRTPLNSLLILSEFLAENKENNLTDKQKEYLRTIHISGTDLLKMIDEILDLAKVDAGKMDLHPEWTVIGDVTNFLDSMFSPLAAHKGLTLHIETDDQLPQAIWTDAHRLKQILRNLLSNAIKFTHEGSVSLRIGRPRAEDLEAQATGKEGHYLAFAVTDTGIGIAPERSGLIFEAFRQADGTTSRKYGGTGLGLTISRELARLFGGWIRLETEPGRGSTFTLVLPERTPEQAAVSEESVDSPAYAEVAASLLTAGDTLAQTGETPDERGRTDGEQPAVSADGLPDDRESIQNGDKVLLIVEDDVNFAKILVEMAHSRGFKAVVSLRGDEGLQLARSLKPDAVLLDIQLPGADGWSVLHALKNDLDTRHIPVHVVSVSDEASHGLRMGAIDHLQKPVTAEKLGNAFAKIAAVLERRPKHLLLVEPNVDDQRALTELIGHDDVSVLAVDNVETAWSRLQKEIIDCIVVSAALDEKSTIQLLKRMEHSAALRRIPVILYGADEDREEDFREFRKFADTIVLWDIKSPERLLEQTALFLHRVESELPEEKRTILRKLHLRDSPFENKKILLVDDDVRNVFALSSVLEHHRMEVVYAENGREAIRRMEEHPDVDLILMDIMMPEMDGYEAMRQIRGNPVWKSVPIIAVTAKAMRDDRSKCIEAGASDYIMKPVHTDQLLSLMRVWLYR